MRAALTAVALALVVTAPPLAYASGRDGRNGNGKPYACNPQAECLTRAATLKGPAADAARRDCGRMPSAGTCFSPDDTQADRGGRTDFDRADGSDRKRK